jgi:hypothetical protein
MNKRLAVLLLRVAGAPDLPTKDYAEKLFTNAGRGTRNLVDYYDEVSHGWLDIGPSRVFDWIDYGHTRQDLVDFANKAKAAHKQPPSMAARRRPGSRHQPREIQRLVFVATRRRW